MIKAITLPYTAVYGGAAPGLVYNYDSQTTNYRDTSRGDGALSVSGYPQQITIPENGVPDPIAATLNYNGDENYNVTVLYSRSSDAGLYHLEFSASQVVPRPVYGCTDPLATNYNSAANYDNGSCVYSSSPPAPPPPPSPPAPPSPPLAPEAPVSGVSGVGISDGCGCKWTANPAPVCGWKKTTSPVCGTWKKARRC